MKISRESVEIILDLIEIKMSTIQIHDKDDDRDLNKLRKCRQELHTLQSLLNAESMDRASGSLLKRTDHNTDRS